MMKTVVELDLVAYSDIARTLEESAGTETVSKLNDEIQGFVDAGLRTVGLGRQHTVMATTGDGAILVFDRPEEAHRFAEAAHNAARTHNASKTEPSAKRVFRMGAATGDLSVKARGDGGFDIAGITIAVAVRLESRSDPGGLVIDEATYTQLPHDLKMQYQGPFEVPGKRAEVYRVWRCEMDRETASPPETKRKAPPAKERKADRREFEESFALLDFMDQMDLLCSIEGALSRLVQAMGITYPERPSDSLSRGEQCSKIHDWAAAHHQEEKLKVLVQKLLIKYGL